jgi:ferrous iron transport protein A
VESLDATDRDRTLSALRTGQRGVVRGLRGGRTFCSRAANLGFTTGTQVLVIQNYGRGPMIVGVRGTRVALGREEADNVLVDMTMTTGAGEP